MKPLSVVGRKTAEKARSLLLGTSLVCWDASRSSPDLVAPAGLPDDPCGAPAGLHGSSQLPCALALSLAEMRRQNRHVAVERKEQGLLWTERQRMGTELP